MEANIANEEMIGENKTLLSKGKETPSAPDLDNGDNSNQPQGVQDANQIEASDDSPDEPRDDDDNPNVAYSPVSGAPSHEQTGQLPPARSHGSDADDDIEDERILSFLGPVVYLIAAIAVIWVMRLFLPLIKAFTGSVGGEKALYGCMIALPVFLIAVAILLVIRVFMSLSAGVDCRYSPDYKAKRALREKLIRKYLKGFTTDKNLYRLIGKDAQAKLKRLNRGANDDIDGWIKDYKEFQEALKRRAEEERDKYARAITVATMASPKSQFDAMVTLFFSTAMLLSIARIFNKRTTRIGAFRLACSWSLNLFLSGHLQGLGKKIGDAIGTGVEMCVGAVSNPVAGKLAGGAVRTVAGVTIEGGINRHMAKSLGDKAIKYFAAVKGL